MNDFFNTNTTKTYSISTTKGDYTFTAQDIAKIVAFGERYITWSGSETWISASAVADMLAIFCTEEGEERGQLRTELCAKVDIYTDQEDKAFKAIINEARDVLVEWGSAKLYTCLAKKFQGSEERYINLDRLEAALGIELGDTVRERLSHVAVFKDSDGDWVFDSATGRSYRDTATIGILTEVRDAVQFFPTMLKHCIEIAKQGFSTFEEIAEESFSIKLERWTQSDKDDMKRALAQEDLTPDCYTVYFTTHNEFGMGISEEVASRWDFAYEVANFATKKEAAEFRSAANKNFSIEKKRQKLLSLISDAEQHLADLREEYLTLLD
jgi:hypothetical protein